MYILKIEQARFQDKGSVNQTADSLSLILAVDSTGDVELPPSLFPSGIHPLSIYTAGRGPLPFTLPPQPPKDCLFYFVGEYPVVLFGGCKGLWESETAVSGLFSIELVVWPHPPSNEK